MVIIPDKLKHIHLKPWELVDHNISPFHNRFQSFDPAEPQFKLRHNESHSRTWKLQTTV